MPTTKRLRNLVLILGDQLDAESAVFQGFDPKLDAVWMAEVSEESTHVWSHKTRIALFLSAMRHYRDWLTKTKKYTVHYTELSEQSKAGTLAAELELAIKELQPAKLIMVEAGDFRVQDSLSKVAKKNKVHLDIRQDEHFFSTLQEFNAHATGRKQLRLEYFYRELRRKTGILMDDDQPRGGEWNYDSENRGTFGKAGPGKIPSPIRFTPDKLTKDVIQLVEKKFAGHPGKTEHFDWPVTFDQARQALDDFIANRLADFGTYQDAMWTNEPWLYHSRISSSLNLKLLNPRTVCTAAEEAEKKGVVPLAAAEGFIRQILGWREYVRGIYWRFMPDYLEGNTLNAQNELPGIYWTADTDMNCMKQALTQTLDFGYAHHIQRLMVTGLFSLLFGVHPKKIHEWYLAVYVDAVEWVELPNTLGMSQFADGGIMASKPYCASGKYIQRMSNYCKGCQYDPAESLGKTACPFTTLYWDFLMKNEKMLAANPRTVMQVRNVARMDSTKKQAIQEQAKQLRISLTMAK